MLLGVEAIRASSRYGPDSTQEAREWLWGVSLLPLNDTVLDLATSLAPPLMRALDALHLATALTVRDEIGAFFTYDQRLGEAAADHGFAVVAPNQD